MLHKIENKIEGAFVFPEMARSDPVVNLGEETVRPDEDMFFHTHLKSMASCLSVTISLN